MQQWAQQTPLACILDAVWRATSSAASYSSQAKFLKSTADIHRAGRLDAKLLYCKQALHRQHGLVKRCVSVDVLKQVAVTAALSASQVEAANCLACMCT